mgnify:CR=1 FL=1
MGASPEKLIESGRLEQARRLLLEDHKRKPEDYRTLFLLGVVLQKLREYPAAERYFRQACRAGPRSHTARFNLGLSLEAQGNREAAVDEYRRSVQLSPSYQPARRRLEALGESIPSINRPQTGRLWNRQRRRGRRGCFYQIFALVVVFFALAFVISGWREFFFRPRPKPRPGPKPRPFGPRSAIPTDRIRYMQLESE